MAAPVSICSDACANHGRYNSVCGARPRRLKNSNAAAEESQLWGLRTLPGLFLKCICMYACMHACMHVGLSVCAYQCMCVCLSAVCSLLCLCVCRPARMLPVRGRQRPFCVLLQVLSCCSGDSGLTFSVSPKAPGTFLRVFRPSNDIVTCYGFSSVP